MRLEESKEGLGNPAAAVQAQTEYHELVLYKSRLHVINSVSQGLTQEIVFTARSAAVGGGSINPLGFTGDTASGTLYLFTGSRH